MHWSGRIKGAAVDWLERRARRALAASRASAVASDRPRIIAAGAAHFPVASQTYVYQELDSMRHGLDAELMLAHTHRGRRRELHHEFLDLATCARRTRVSWHTLRKDLEHFRSTRPRQLRDALELLATETGRMQHELEHDYEVLMALAFARRAEIWGATYVHTYFFYRETMGGFFASQLLGLPRGITAYVDHMMQDHPLKCVRLHLATADLVVATSPVARDELVAIGGAGNADRILVKPNGVDGKLFATRRSAPARNRGFSLVAVNRLEQRKCTLDLVDAVGTLRSRGYALQADIFGGPEPALPGSSDYARAVASRIDALGIADACRLHGTCRRSEIAPALANADAFVAPYSATDDGNREGIPTAILEAMASGLPIVTTDCGSIRCAVEDQGEGLVVPEGDADALTTAIARLIDDPELAATLGTGARRRFEREFDVEVTEPRLHARIRALLSNNRGDAASRNSARRHHRVRQVAR